MSSHVEKSPFFKPTKKNKEIHTTPGGTINIKEDTEDKSSVLGTIGNLMNSIVGCGIVGIAFAIKEAGLVTGVLLVILIALMTEKSLRMLIETAKHIHVPSYEMLCEATFGPAGFYFVCGSMFIMSYGAMIAYLLVVKDTLPVLLGVDETDEAMKNLILIVSSFCIMLPLSCQRDMASLAKTSSLNVVFDTILVVIVCCFAPVRENIASVADGGGLGSIITGSTIHPRTLFAGVGVLSFAFVCHHSSFLICGSLRNPTRQRWATVTRTSLLLCACLALSIGVLGYLAFEDGTQGDILNNFASLSSPASMRAGNVARALLCSTMFFVYPIESFVTRHVLVVVLFSGRQAHEGDDHAVLARLDRRILLTFLLYVSALIPALFFQDLGTVLALSGALGGSCLGYIGPGCTFLAVHGQDFLTFVHTKWYFHNNHHPEQQTQNSCLYNTVSYYILLTPFWASIASFGQETLTQFLAKEALKSPHTNRLGEVKRKPPSSAVNPMKNHARQSSDDSSMNPLLTRSSSFDSRVQQPYSSYGSTKTPTAIPDVALAKSINVLESGVTDRAIASAIAAKYRSGASEEEVVEDDPQGDCPHWADFVLSICFIIFGFIAMAAGFLSIFMGGE